MPALAAVILVGGQSRRFGRDKTALTHNGRLLIAPLVEMLREESFEITLLGPPRPHFAELNCHSLPDHTPHEGPLPAIAGALTRLPADRILVVAADMPFLTRGVLHLLRHYSAKGDLMTLEGGIFPAIYSRGALPAMQDLVDAGHRRLHDLYTRLSASTHVIPKSQWCAQDPEGLSLRNINTPGDWETVRTQT